MSEELISKLLTIAGPLLGALVGGLIASLTARSVERQRWRHERQEKLSGLRRDALYAALEWIEPMRNAEQAPWTMGGKAPTSTPDGQSAALMH